MKVFKTAKSISLLSILWVCAIGLLALPFIPKNDSGIAAYVINSIMIIIAAILIWILLDTSYTLTDSELFYRSGPVRGKISIGTIRKIQYDNSFLKGQTLKPSLGTNGLIVFYNKFDEIYISPKMREEFIAEIIARKPDVEIIN